MAESVEQRIREFMEQGPYAVVGASENREKYGNKVFRAYLQRKMSVYPVHPRAAEVEGVPAYTGLADLPEPVRAISVITPPSVTLGVVEQAARAGVRYVWMQPGAESPEAVSRAEELGLEVIADGSCFLVVAGFQEHRGQA